MIGQPQPQALPQHYNIQVSDLCSELSYFLIFDFPHNLKTPENMTHKPNVITYRNDDITFTQILSKYQKAYRGSNKRQHIKFSLSKGYHIPMKSTVQDLKKNLRRQTIQGMKLFTFQEDESQDQYDGQAIDFQNQCGLMEFIGIQNDFDKKKEFVFHFLLPQSHYVISIEIHPNLRVASLIQLLLKEILKEFKLNLSKTDIKQLRIHNTDKILDSKSIIANSRHLYNDTKIDVILYSSAIQFLKPSQSSNQITFIKQQINPITNTHTSKKITLPYNHIRNMQISMLNQQFFLTEGEIQNKSNPICLKVMQMIIRKEERLCRLDYAIQKLKELGVVKLVGFIISQKIVFYKQIPGLLNIANAKEFTIQQLQIPKQSTTQRNKCQQLINQRLNTIQQSYFQNKQHIQPILVYTSNLKFKDKQGNITKIYDSLNRCLRTQSILMKKTQQIQKDWVYRYTSTLLKHLNKIQGESCQVYRGVNYDPQSQVGELITFKPFTSTSKDITVAVQFAIQKYTEDDSLPLTLFKMKILSGKAIDKLSYYSTEKEILLQPFTEFRITKVQKNVTKSYPPNIPGAMEFNFTVYHLEQVASAREMPKTINNYIIWIDDKPKEGLEIFNKFIEEFHHPTVLFQLPTTAALQHWIEERKAITNDISSKIIMVTNMVRKEYQVKNFYAGVESINLVRTVLPNIPIVIYVRDTNASNNNLNQKNVSRENLEVVSQFEDLAAFISKHIDLKFRSMKPNIELMEHIPPPMPPMVIKKQQQSKSQHMNGEKAVEGGKKSKSELKKEKGKCIIM